MTVSPTKLRFDIEAYYKMYEARIIPQKRIELINGDIIEKPSISSFHAAHVKKITHLLFDLLEEYVIVRVQNPIQLNNYSEPEPDISILKSKADFYASGHPQAEDVLLVIEVADSSLEHDRVVKSKLYAEAGISEYLIINLEESQVELYQNPMDGEYQNVTFAQKEENLVLQSISVATKVSNLLI